MRTVNDVLSQARKRLGIRENPPGSNRTPIGVEFGWNGVAWCAEFVCVCLLDAGFKFPKNASAHGLTDELRRLGCKAVPVKDAAPGDVIDYTFSHTGLCEGRDSHGNVIAIEGNHGDRVARVVRAQSSIARITRPPYAKPAPVPVVPAAPTLHPSNPNYHKRAVIRHDTQLWNPTHGTKRGIARKGGVVSVLSVHKPWASVKWGANEGDIRYDDMKWV